MADVPADVADAEVLHRAANPKANAIAADGRLHHMAFYSSTDPWRISVDRAAYRSAAASLEGRDGWRLARLVTGVVRAIDLAPEPPLIVAGLPEDGNDAHAEIVAPQTLASKKRMKTVVCVKLAAIAELLPEE